MFLHYMDFIQAPQNVPVFIVLEIEKWAKVYV